MKEGEPRLRGMEGDLDLLTLGERDLFDLGDLDLSDAGVLDLDLEDSLRLLDLDLDFDETDERE